MLIRLESPSPDLLHTLASPLCYILPASFEALIRQGAFFRDPIGSGPYRIALRDPLHIKLSINPYYRKPRPWLTEITFQILNSRRGLRREELDRFDLIAGAPMETAVVLPGHRTQTYMHPVVEFLGFNLRHHIWKNRTLREAFAAAFDREAFYRVLYKGRTASWHPADSLIPYGMLARAKTGEGDRNRPHGQFSVTLQLSELFARSEDAVIDFVTAPHIAETKLQRAVDAATRSSGLRLRARKIALADFIDQARRGAAGIFVMQLAADIPDPHEILINFTDDGPVNYTGYTGLTAPLRTVLSTTSRRDRAATYAALAEQLRQEAVAIPIASVLNEKLFVRKGLALTQMNQYGPWYYPLNMVQPEI
ncbi:MAG: hypothetical protein HYV03_08820 [Deltaproteobacteria bacterium]|nr:hypothetical protein [Deltaproteobacteria bacterium]